MSEKFTELLPYFFDLFILADASFSASFFTTNKDFLKMLNGL